MDFLEFWMIEAQLSSPDHTFLDRSILKALNFADEKLYFIEKLQFVLGRVENIVGKEENAGNQFILFPQFFFFFLPS